MGGAVAAIEAGFYQDEIHEAAFRIQRGIESGDRVVVGVNRFEEADEQPPQLLRISDEEVAGQVESVPARERDGSEVRRRLADLARTAQGTGNLLPPMKEAASRATLGEVSDVLRETFGEYHPTH